MRKLLSRLILIGIFLPVYSHAVGLGELEVFSSLNEPLNAEIELVSVPAADIYSLDVRLAPSDVFDEIGIERPILLTKLSFDPRVENGRPVIKVSSPGPVTEPFLNFVVEVTWPQGRFLREYTALLDPPTYNATGVASVAAPASGISNAEVITPYEPYEPYEDSGTYETYSESSYDNTTGGDFVPYSELDNATVSSGVVDYSTESYDTGASYSNDTYASESYAEYDSYVEGVTDYVEGVTDIESLPIAQTFPMDGGDVAYTDSYTDSTYTDSATYTDPADSFDDSGYTAYSDTDTSSSYTESEYTYTEDSAGITYDTEYADSGLAGDDGYYDVGFGEYQVESGDMLWNIADAHRSDDVTVSQMMIAMLQENPEAFIDNNINLLKSGYVLRIPDMAAASGISRGEALAAVKNQTDLWRQYRGTMAQVAVPQQAVGDNRAGAQPARSNPPATSARTGDLEIVVPKANQGSAGTVLADAGIISDLEEQVQLAQEQVKSADREKAELASRVAELEGMLKSKDRLLELKDDQLNELQRNVGGAEMVVEEAKPPEQIAPEPQPPIEVPEEFKVPPPLPPKPVTEAEPSEPILPPQPYEPEVPPQTAEVPPPVGVQPPRPPRSAPPPQVREPVVEPEPEPEVVEAEPVVPVAPPKQVADVQSTPAKQTPWYLNKAFLGGMGGLAALLGGGYVVSRKRRAAEFEKAALELQEYHDSGDVPDVINNVVDDVKTPTGMLEMEDRFEDGTQSDLTNVEVTNEDLVADAEKVLTEVSDGHEISDADTMADFGGEEDLTQETALTEENELNPTDRINLENGAFVPKVDADLSADAPLDEDFTAELDATPFKEPTSDGLEDEVSSELDIYLAYGLNDQVIEQAKQQLEKEPGNHGYWQRLFKAYKEKDDKEAFAEEAALYKDKVGKDSTNWSEIAVLGAAIDPQNPLYAEASDSSVDADDLMPSKPENLDIQFEDDKVEAENLESAGEDVEIENFQETQVIEPFGVSPEQHDALLGDSVDSIEDELVETVILEDSSLDELRAASNAATSSGMSLDALESEAESELPSSEETSEFEYELSSIKGSETETASAGADITEILPDEEVPSFDLETEDDDDEFTLDFDMPDANGAAIATGTAAAAAAATATATGAIPDLSQTIKITDDDKEELLDLPEFSLDSLDDAMSGEDEMATKLDLAKAYVDMGDDEGARDALNEVISSGNDQQKVEAERLLNQLQ